MTANTRLLIFLLSFMLPASQVTAVTLTAEETVRDSTQEILNRLHTDQVKLKSSPEYIQVIVKELIVPHFDFATMSRLVLGRYWTEINKSEKICFTHGFKNLLVRRYADIFLGYDDKIIAYQPTDPIGEEGVVVVTQTITKPGEEPFLVKYPLRPNEYGWKVIDLNIDGISLLKSYSGTFQNKINKQGIHNFIQSFNECNDKRIKYDSQSVVIDPILNLP